MKKMIGLILLASFLLLYTVGCAKESARRLSYEEIMEIENVYIEADYADRWDTVDEVCSFFNDISIPYAAVKGTVTDVKYYLENDLERDELRGFSVVSLRIEELDPAHGNAEFAIGDTVFIRQNSYLNYADTERDWRPLFAERADELITVPGQNYQWVEFIPIEGETYQKFVYGREVPAQIGATYSAFLNQVEVPAAGYDVLYWANYILPLDWQNNKYYLDERYGAGFSDAYISIALEIQAMFEK